jgi:phosphotransferase system enzyme I (PtsI)
VDLFPRFLHHGESEDFRINDDLWPAMNEGRAIPPPEGGGESRHQGIPVSPGIARGVVVVRSDGFLEPVSYKVRAEQLPAELDRFEVALVETRGEIHGLQQAILESGRKSEASIFDAHLLILEDKSVLDEVGASLEKDRWNIETGFYRVMRRFMDSLRSIDDPYLRERVIDIEDVAKRVLRKLARGGDAMEKTVGHAHILLALDLTPSDTAEMDPALVLGFATEMGSVTSHTAIVARSMGIPAVVGLHGIREKVHTGARILLDGYDGLLIVDPSDETLANYSELEKAKSAVVEKLVELRDTRARTTDGAAIILSANIEFAHESTAVINSGAEGVGLYRTEFLYMNPRALPGEEEQAENYARVAAAVNPHGVIIRTLDIGGDKMPVGGVAYQEANPFLGWRGIRMSLELPDLFRSQVRAILRASAAGTVRIMFPLISGLEELRRAKAHVENCKDELRKAGVSFDEKIQIGAMIEVPSAAVIADQLATEVDFFSIGTNDLIQYTLAVDRVNDRVARLYQPEHPAIIRLLKQIVDAAHRAKIWAGVCGEMAGDIQLTPFLVGIGIDELSVSPSLIPRVKSAVQKLEAAACRTLASEVLSLNRSADIRERCKAIAMEHYPELLI